MTTQPKVAYILPNLFTAASIFFGILSLLASVRGEFEQAGHYIFLSLIADGLDGRVARLTNTTSRFGMEFDSLADVVAFGVAPAMLFYFSIGWFFGKVGVLVAALFVIFGAIRLARFNIIANDDEPNVFIGLPIPTAAVFVTTLVLVTLQYSDFKSAGIALVVATLAASLLMVSHIRFPSFKKIDFRRANFMKLLVGLIFLLSLLYLYAIETLAILTIIYIGYGTTRAFYYRFLRKNRVH
ncbi:MAG: CDP-diacylglycerol--serine O-phosphatidyltransferase [Campylobacterales bacterium]